MTYQPAIKVNVLFLFDGRINAMPNLIRCPWNAVHLVPSGCPVGCFICGQTRIQTAIQCIAETWHSIVVSIYTLSLSNAMNCTLCLQLRLITSIFICVIVPYSPLFAITYFLILQLIGGVHGKYILHWGSSHEGSGRHPRQHGGGRGRRFDKFTANSHRVCALLRPSFGELIVNVMGNIDAESRAAVIRYLAAIPA